MIIVPHRSSGPTRRSRVLAQRLRATIAEVQRLDPKLSDEDVRAALVDVGASARIAPPRLRSALAILAGLLTGIGALLVTVTARDGRQFPVIPGIAAVLVVVAVVAVTILRSHDDQ